MSEKAFRYFVKDRSREGRPAFSAIYGYFDLQTLEFNKEIDNSDVPLVNFLGDIRPTTFFEDIDESGNPYVYTIKTATRLDLPDQPNFSGMSGLVTGSAVELIDSFKSGTLSGNLSGLFYNLLTSGNIDTFIYDQVDESGNIEKIYSYLSGSAGETPFVTNLPTTSYDLDIENKIIIDTGISNNNSPIDTIGTLTSSSEIQYMDSLTDNLSKGASEFAYLQKYSGFWDAFSQRYIRTLPLSFFNPTTGRSTFFNFTNGWKPRIGHGGYTISQSSDRSHPFRDEIEISYRALQFGSTNNNKARTYLPQAEVFVKTRYGGSNITDHTEIINNYLVPPIEYYRYAVNEAPIDPVTGPMIVYLDLESNSHNDLFIALQAPGYGKETTTSSSFVLSRGRTVVLKYGSGTYLYDKKSIGSGSSYFSKTAYPGANPVFPNSAGISDYNSHLGARYHDRYHGYPTGLASGQIPWYNLSGGRVAGYVRYRTARLSMPSSNGGCVSGNLLLNCALYNSCRLELMELNTDLSGVIPLYDRQKEISKITGWQWYNLLNSGVRLPMAEQPKFTGQNVIIKGYNSNLDWCTRHPEDRDAQRLGACDWHGYDYGRQESSLEYPIIEKGFTGTTFTGVRSLFSFSDLYLTNPTRTKEVNLLSGKSFEDIMNGVYPGLTGKRAWWSYDNSITYQESVVFDDYVVSGFHGSLLTGEYYRYRKDGPVPPLNDPNIPQSQQYNPNKSYDIYIPGDWRLDLINRGFANSDLYPYVRAPKRECPGLRLVKEPLDYKDICWPDVQILNSLTGRVFYDHLNCVVLRDPIWMPSWVSGIPERALVNAVNNFGIKYSGDILTHPDYRITGRKIYRFELPEEFLGSSLRGRWDFQIAHAVPSIYDYCGIVHGASITFNNRIASREWISKNIIIESKNQEWVDSWWSDQIKLILQDNPGDLIVQKNVAPKTDFSIMKIFDDKILDYKGPPKIIGDTNLSSEFDIYNKFPATSVIHSNKSGIVTGPVTVDIRLAHQDLNTLRIFLKSPRQPGSPQNEIYKDDFSNGIILQLKEDFYNNIKYDVNREDLISSGIYTGIETRRFGIEQTPCDRCWDEPSPYIRTSLRREFKSGYFYATNPIGSRVPGVIKRNIATPGNLSGNIELFARVTVTPDFYNYEQFVDLVQAYPNAYTNTILKDTSATGSLIPARTRCPGKWFLTGIYVGGFTGVGTSENLFYSTGPRHFGAQDSTKPLNYIQELLKRPYATSIFQPSGNDLLTSIKIDLISPTGKRITIHDRYNLEYWKNKKNVNAWTNCFNKEDGRRLYTIYGVDDRPVSGPQVGYSRVFYHDPISFSRAEFIEFSGYPVSGFDGEDLRGDWSIEVQTFEFSRGLVEGWPLSPKDMGMISEFDHLGRRIPDTIPGTRFIGKGFERKFGLRYSGYFGAPVSQFNIPEDARQIFFDNPNELKTISFVLPTELLGANKSGDWKINIEDGYADSTGILYDWTIYFGNNPQNINIMNPYDPYRDIIA